MNDRLKEAFDQIHAEEELKERTRAFLAKEMERRSRSGSRRRLVPALACVLVLLLGLGGFGFFLTPTSVISIDVNPSLELGINRFGRVVSVVGYNDDGETLARSLDVNFMTYTEAVEAILASQQLASYLTQDGVVAIAVAGADADQTEQMLVQLRSCTEDRENTHCYSTDLEEVASAHDAGLSCGKYRAYLELLALDPDVTVEEVREMSMREIRERIQALSGGDAGETTASDERSGHHGNGWGHGYGSGHE